MTENRNLDPRLPPARLGAGLGLLDLLHALVTEEPAYESRGAAPRSCISPVVEPDAFARPGLFDDRLVRAPLESDNGWVQRRNVRSPAHAGTAIEGRAHGRQAALGARRDRRSARGPARGRARAHRSRGRRGRAAPARQGAVCAAVAREDGTRSRTARRAIKRRHRLGMYGVIRSHTGSSCRQPS
jgi:hypothetical protein